MFNLLGFITTVSVMANNTAWWMA